MPTIYIQNNTELSNNTPTITASNFVVADNATISIGHESTDWIIEDDHTKEQVYSSLNDNVRLSSITVPSGILKENNNYTVKVKYNSNCDISSSIGTLPLITKKFTNLKTGDYLEGGYFVGSVSLNGKLQKIILSSNVKGTKKCRWKKQSDTIPFENTEDDGFLNTTILKNFENYVAANWALNVIINNFNDWYIPSINELVFLYNNALNNQMENFSPTVFCSSTIHDKNHLKGVDFNTGDIVKVKKYDPAMFRLIRKI